MTKVYLLSLGCPRNMVDSEVLSGLLEQNGNTIIEKPEGADAAIVNTCGFIRDAKQESIDVVLQLAELKKNGKIKCLIVTGCLSQRYPEELMDEIREIDGVFGTADFIKIPDELNSLLSGKKIRQVNPRPGFLYDHSYRRRLLSPSHYAYVKIQEGCSNRCSYCVIPDLKGPLRSRETASVLEEIKRLRDEHDIKEVILTGQDTTSFGRGSAVSRGTNVNKRRCSGLADLLREISPLMENRWIRLLYTHPAHFADELIEVIADTDNICKYVDLPIQHANDLILQKMNRRVTKSGITSLIERLRERIDGLTLRTSVITGFPGETDKEFEELLGFLEDTRFDRLGAFIYSREDGTPAAGFEGQVPDEIKRARFDEIMKLQRKISRENNQKFLGRTLKTLIDEKDLSGAGRFTGRSQMDSPEVDGMIYVTGDGVTPGEFTDVRITGTMEYDLTGEAV